MSTPPTTASPAAPAVACEPSDPQLALRKQRLVEAARAIDPLKSLRRHPFVTVAAAAAIGVVAASPVAARTVSVAWSSGLVTRALKTAFSSVIAGFAAGRAAVASAEPKESESTPPT